MHLEEFVNRVKETYENNLESIVLYGSAVSQDFSQKYSDYNLIIVLKEIVPAELAKASKLVTKWTKSGNPIPLFFDPHHIKTSTDVFPIEFHDITASRKVLFGSDPFTGLTIENTNLRHQCESELKGKILQLQSRFVTVGNSNKAIGRLMMESLSTFMSVFGGIARLLGHSPAEKKRELVEQLSTYIDFNPTIFMELLDIREGEAILPRDDAAEKFEDYLTQLKIITDFVDGFET